MKTLEQLYERVEQLGSATLRDDSPVTRDDVGHLIDDARAYLTGADGKIGPWEEELLACAAGPGFLRTAIVCVGKALDVNQLPAAEYDYGFNYVQR